MRLFMSWKCILPVIEEPQCNHFQERSSWLHRQGVALFCIRSCRRRTESICSPRNKIHLMVLICFYSVMQVHTDSLGMVRSLHYSGYSDMTIFVMASYTQLPYKISFVTTVSDSSAMHASVLSRPLRHVLWCDLAHLVLVCRLGQTGIHLGISLGLEGADLLSIIADSRVCRMRLTERYQFIHIHSGVRIHVEAALFSDVTGTIEYS